MASGGRKGRSREDPECVLLLLLATVDIEVPILDNETAQLRQTVTELHAVLCAHEQKHQCEALYAQGRIQDAAEALLKIVDTPSEAVRTNKLIVGWVSSEFLCHELVENLDPSYQRLRASAYRNWK